MQVAADLRQPGHRLEKSRRNMARMRARETDALDALDVVNRFEEPGEIATGVVRRNVMIDDLAEQLHFAAAARRRLANLRDDVGLRTHPLVPARVRDDAEAA